MLTPWWVSCSVQMLLLRKRTMLLSGYMDSLRIATILSVEGLFPFLRKQVAIEIAIPAILVKRETATSWPGVRETLEIRENVFEIKNFNLGELGASKYVWKKQSSVQRVQLRICDLLHFLHTQNIIYDVQEPVVCPQDQGSFPSNCIIWSCKQPFKF